MTAVNEIRQFIDSVEADIELMSGCPVCGAGTDQLCMVPTDFLTPETEPHPERAARQLDKTRLALKQALAYLDAVDVWALAYLDADV
jgi:hypothetical protein